jgi:molybdate transport system permease protein
LAARNEHAVTEAELSAVLLSLRVSAVTLLVTMPVAMAVAWLLARRSFPGKVLVDALVHLPLVLPPVVTGFILLIVLGRDGVVGGWLADTFGITFAFRWTGAVIAAGVMAFPLMVRPMRLAFEAVDPRLEAAAATLGAPPWRVFASVTVPLALPGVVAGAILGFAKSLGEFGATITFVSNIPGETRTLSLAVHSLLQIPGQEWAAFRLALVGLIVSLAAIIASEILAARLRRRIRPEPA